MTLSRKRVGVLISGRGSNMRSLVDAARAEDFPAEIALVLSNVADAAGLDFAQRAGNRDGGGRSQSFRRPREFRARDA